MQTTKTYRAIEEAIISCRTAIKSIEENDDCPSIKDALLEQMKLAEQMQKSGKWLYHNRARIETRMEELEKPIGG